MLEGRGLETSTHSVGRAEAPVLTMMGQMGRRAVSVSL